MTLEADLVLEGGGVKGIGLLGAVARLDCDVRFRRVAGSSAGAIVAALVAAGCSGDELHALLADFPMQKVRDKSALDRVPLVGPVSSALFADGVYETRFVRDWVAERLVRHGVRTFADLRESDPDSSLPEERRYRLVVTATDVTTGELLYLPWDYRSHFGLDPDRQPVADAVAASIAIPFFFKPVHLTDVRTQRDHVLVDGGVLANYPITVFDRTDGEEMRWPTFGVKIIPQLPMHDAEMLPAAGRFRLAGLRHLEAVLATMIAGRDQTYLERPCVSMRTIRVDTREVTIVDWDVDAAVKQQVYANGWNAADQFLVAWGDGSSYRARCARRRE